MASRRKSVAKRGVKDTSEELYAGYLLKQGDDFIGKWKKRYFRLTQDYIHYCKNPQDKEVSSVPLIGASLSDASKKKKKSGCIELKAGPRSYYLQAENVDAFDNWMIALEMAIEAAGRKAASTETKEVAEKDPNASSKDTAGTGEVATTAEETKPGAPAETEDKAAVEGVERETGGEAEAEAEGEADAAGIPVSQDDKTGASVEASEPARNAVSASQVVEDEAEAEAAQAAEAAEAAEAAAVTGTPAVAGGAAVGAASLPVKEHAEAKKDDDPTDASADDDDSEAGNPFDSDEDEDELAPIGIRRDGWLSIRKPTKKWEKLWFVLAGGRMVYYKEGPVLSSVVSADLTREEIPSAGSLQGIISLENCDVGERPSKKSEGAAFRIYHSQNDNIAQGSFLSVSALVLLAATPADRSMWMADLQEAIEDFEESHEKLVSYRTHAAKRRPIPSVVSASGPSTKSLVAVEVEVLDANVTVAVQVDPSATLLEVCSTVCSEVKDDVDRSEHVLFLCERNPQSAGREGDWLKDLAELEEGDKLFFIKPISKSASVAQKRDRTRPQCGECEAALACGRCVDCGSVYCLECFHSMHEEDADEHEFDMINLVVDSDTPSTAESSKDEGSHKEDGEGGEQAPPGEVDQTESLHADTKEDDEDGAEGVAPTLPALTRSAPLSPRSRQSAAATLDPDSLEGKVYNADANTLALLLDFFLNEMPLAERSLSYLQQAVTLALGESAIFASITDAKLTAAGSSMMQHEEQEGAVIKSSVLSTPAALPEVKGKEGMVAMRGAFKKWSKKWLVLKGQQLMYYSDHKGENLKDPEVIDLCGCEVAVRPSKMSGYCFKVFHPQGQAINKGAIPSMRVDNCLLLVQREAEMDAWISSIRNAIRVANEVGFGVMRREGALFQISDTCTEAKARWFSLDGKALTCYVEKDGAAVGAPLNIDHTSSATATSSPRGFKVVLEGRNYQFWADPKLYADPNAEADCWLAAFSAAINAAGGASVDVWADCDCEGFLTSTTTGKLRAQKWKRSWFRLRDKTLYSFKKPQDTSPTMELPLAGCNITDVSTKTKKPFSFEVATVSKTVVLCAPTESALGQWVDALHACGYDNRGGLTGRRAAPKPSAAKEGSADAQEDDASASAKSKLATPPSPKSSTKRGRAATKESSESTPPPPPVVKITCRQRRLEKRQARYAEAPSIASLSKEVDGTVLAKKLTVTSDDVDDKGEMLYEACIRATRNRDALRRGEDYFGSVDELEEDFFPYLRSLLGIDDEVHDEVLKAMGIKAAVKAQGDEGTCTWADPLKEGFMIKQSGGGKRPKTWQNRWFRLTRTHLYYFKTSSDLVETGMVSLEGAEVRDVKDRKRPYCFGVKPVDKERVFVLDAGSAKEIKAWRAAVREAIEVLAKQADSGGAKLISPLEEGNTDAAITATSLSGASDHTKLFGMLVFHFVMEGNGRKKPGLTGVQTWACECYAAKYTVSKPLASVCPLYYYVAGCLEDVEERARNALELPPLEGWQAGAIASSVMPFLGMQRRDIDTEEADLLHVLANASRYLLRGALARYRRAFPDGRPRGTLQTVIDAWLEVSPGGEVMALVSKEETCEDDTLKSVLEEAAELSVESLGVRGDDDPADFDWMSPVDISTVCMGVLELINDEVATYGQEFTANGADVFVVQTMYTIVQELVDDMFVQTSNPDLSDLFALCGDLHQLVPRMVELSPDLAPMPLGMLFAPYMFQFLSEAKERLCDWNSRAIGADQWKAGGGGASTCITDVFSCLDQVFVFFKDFAWLVDDPNDDPTGVVDNFAETVTEIMQDFSCKVYDSLVEGCPRAAAIAAVEFGGGREDEQGHIKAFYHPQEDKKKKKKAKDEPSIDRRLTSVDMADEVEAVTEAMCVHVNDIETARFKMNEMLESLEEEAFDVADKFLGLFSSMKGCIKRASLFIAYTTCTWLEPSIVALTPFEVNVMVPPMFAYLDNQISMTMELLSKKNFQMYLLHVWLGIVTFLERLLFPTLREVVEQFIDYMHADGQGLSEDRMWTSASFVLFLCQMFERPTDTLIQMHDNASENPDLPRDAVSPEQIVEILKLRPSDRTAVDFLVKKQKKEKKDKRITMLPGAAARFSVFGGP